MEDEERSEFCPASEPSSLQRGSTFNAPTHGALGSLLHNVLHASWITDRHDPSQPKEIEKTRKKMIEAASGLDPLNRPLALRLGLECFGVHPLGSVSPAVLLLFAASVEHGATQILCIVNGLGQEALSRGAQRVSTSTRGSRRMMTYLSSLATSPTLPHLARNPVLYSFRAISRLSIVPNFSPARAFQMRRLESSDPDSTNLLSSV